MLTGLCLATNLLSIHLERQEQYWAKYSADQGCPNSPTRANSRNLISPLAFLLLVTPSLFGVSLNTFILPALLNKSFWLPRSTCSSLCKLSVDRRKPQHEFDFNFTSSTAFLPTTVNNDELYLFWLPSSTSSSSSLCRKYNWFCPPGFNAPWKLAK